MVGLIRERIDASTWRTLLPHYNDLPPALRDGLKHSGTALPDP